MSTYENAPATRMLATHCAVCRRPLVDAKSVEIGMGPDCRKKHGFNIDVPEAARRQANVLVHDIALLQSGEADHRTAILAKTATLLLLGFDKLSAILIKRTAEVRIEVAGDRMHVHAPYRESVVPAWRGIPGRQWDKATKTNTVPLSNKDALWSFLKRHYAGCTGYGPRGPFEIVQANQ